ncbi:MAG: hypothetical protein ACYTGR_10205, partial [Planctomycetota bacterium]
EPSRLMARMLDAQMRWMEEQVRLGFDPDEIRPGRCACNDAWWQMMMETSLRFMDQEAGR